MSPLAALANPFCWLLGDNSVVPKGFQRQRNVPETYFFPFQPKCVKHVCRDGGRIFDLGISQKEEGEPAKRVENI